MRRTAALLAMLALGLSACGAITGRPFVEERRQGDHRARQGYLSGIVDSAETKARTEAAATAVQGVRQVVSNLVAREAARDRDGVAPSALPAAAMARPVPALLIGVVRLEGSRAYDEAGRHVATVYTVPITDLAHTGAERFAAPRPVDHVTVHAMPGDSSVPTAHYLLVLWHVPGLTPAR